MHTSRPQHEQPDIPADVLARRWTILGLLCLNLVIVIIGNTSLNVAIPRLSEDLGASNTALQWMVDAYSLVFAGMLLTAGSFGDRFGRKGALQLGLAIFGVASLAAAMSQSSGQVIAARAVMGLGGAFVMPSTLSMISNVFPEEERAKAIAIWAGVAGAGGGDRTARLGLPARALLVGVDLPRQHPDHRRRHPHRALPPPEVERPRPMPRSTWSERSCRSWACRRSSTPSSRRPSTAGSAPSPSSPSASRSSC